MEKLATLPNIKVVILDPVTFTISMSPGTQAYSAPAGAITYSHFPEVGQTKNGLTRVVRILKYQWFNATAPAPFEVATSTPDTNAAILSRFDRFVWASYVFSNTTTNIGNFFGGMDLEQRRRPRLMEHYESFLGQNNFNALNSGASTPFANYVNYTGGVVKAEIVKEGDEYIIHPWIAVHSAIALWPQWNIGYSWHYDMAYSLKIWYEYVWISSIKYNQLRNEITGGATLFGTKTMTGNGNSSVMYM